MVFSRAGPPIDIASHAGASLTGDLLDKAW
jgi:hypothetical protein